MKLIITIAIGFLLVGGSAFATNPIVEIEADDLSESIIFSDKFDLLERDGYLKIEHEHFIDFLSDPGKPLLPIIHKTYRFSNNVRIDGISCEISEVDEMIISKKIYPCPEEKPYNILKNVNTMSEIYEDEEIYSSSAIYPDSWYDYSVHCGLDEKNNPRTFVKVNIYPIRYSPSNSKLYILDSINIDIKYFDPGVKNDISAKDSYDLVIIAPSYFTDGLESFVEHKNNHGMKTILKTTEEIYNEYQGRDPPEQIKYFIKYAKETYDITYVLLAGGLKSYIFAKDRDDINQGSKHWYVPVRYANIRHSDEKSCISDLYYGDIYKYNETSQEWEFEDWDSNGDNIFAKSGFQNADVLDLMPDVYVGRLACRNKIDLKIILNKIIKYESTSPDEKPWYRKMVGIGGKTFNIYEGKPDGEWACDLSYEYMSDQIDEYVTVYASNNNTGGLRPVTDDIITAVSDGSGYILFQGHGNPSGWNTIWADGEYADHDWCGGIGTFRFGKFQNGEKLPVVVVGGCHNGLFNISMIQILLKRTRNPHWYWVYDPTPFCFSWGLCVMPQGGAIASTGCTGYGFDYTNPISHSGGLETNFFYEIGQNGVKTLGGAHSGSIRKYILENKIRLDEYFCITIFELFGDPSMMLGGYPK
jgi:hypothetical protein